MGKYAKGTGAYEGFDLQHPDPKPMYTVTPNCTYLQNGWCKHGHVTCHFNPLNERNPMRYADMKKIVAHCQYSQICLSQSYT
jgi:hypothetical protein